MIINSNAQSTDGIYKLKSRGFDFITKSTFFSIITWIITQLQLSNRVNDNFSSSGVKVTREIYEITKLTTLLTNVDNLLLELK
jgi:hypothetical protein